MRESRIGPNTSRPMATCLSRARWRAAAIVFPFLSLSLLASCAAPPASIPAGGERSSQPRQAATVKRLVAATPGTPLAFNERVARAVVSGPYRGGPELEWLLSSALTIVDDRGNRLGQLAEMPPTTENGLWKVFPDGRMETTWTIRNGTLWHDATPFTSDDLLFTAMVVRDREMAAFRHEAFDAVESVEAPDARTVTVKWKRPLILADTLFSHALAAPMPKHLLEKPYQDDKTKFLYLPHWLSEYTGTGPFKLKSFLEGSHLVLEANERYVLGRPKLEEIEVKIILDPSVMVSNVLAGAVDLVLGYSAISLERGLELRDQWRDGQVLMVPNAWIVIHPQFVDPNPPIVADVRFRRALLHGIDRQEMVDTLQAGLVSIAHSYLSPNEPEYPEIESGLMRYDYDPRRAGQMIEDLGYGKGPDGFYRDSAGQRLAVEIRSTEGLDIQVKSAFVVAGYWQRLGVGAEPLISPVQQSQDRQWASTFPSFSLIRTPNALEELNRRRISQTPLPENNFVGQNRTRYMNREYSDLIDRYFATVPRAERILVLRQIMSHISEQLNEMGLFYNVLAVAIGKRVQNATAGAVAGSTQAWNAHEWDVK